MIRKLFMVGIFYILVSSIPLIIKADTSLIDKEILDQRINDEVHILTAEEQKNLEQMLSDYEDSTSTQIVVVIVQSLDEEISDVAFRLGKKWKIGQEKRNNGLLILISYDQKEMFIATGYGLEGILPDILCKRVIENEMKPNFKSEKYYEGIKAGIVKIIKLIGGEYKSEHVKALAEERQSIVLGICLILCFVGAIICVANFIAGIFVGALLSSIAVQIGLHLSLGQLFVAFLVSAVATAIIYAVLASKTGEWSSSGGSYSSGGSSGGFFGGGGSFGGGGAGGSW